MGKPELKKNAFYTAACSKTVGLAYRTNDSGQPVDYYHSFNPDGFNYIAEGRWADWVGLAKWILEEDTRRKGEEDA